MNLYDCEIDPIELPFDLEDCQEEFGRIERAFREGPGIYFLQMSALENHSISLSFYAVMNHAPVSDEARRYGQCLLSHPELLLYQYEGEDFYYKIVEYELLKFYEKNHMPMPDCESIRSFAAFGRELCPEYFGTFPAPSVTPWGYTARYKTIKPGIFWIETDQCKITLAISYVMRDDISDEIYKLAYIMPFDEEQGLDETMGYFFFQEKDMCLPIFEILLSGKSREWDMIDIPALMNAVWQSRPEYAMAHNLREQRGENNSFSMIMRNFAPAYEYSGSSDNMVLFSPNAGVQFLRL